MMFGALVALPALTGCPGSLEGDFPTAMSSGSGGDGSSSGGATGSGGSGSGGAVGSGGSTATVCDAPNTVIKTSCATSSCHGGPQPPSLLASGLAGRLIGQPGSECPPSTEKNLVDSTKPASGLLLLRIAGSTCIEQMPPPPASPLSAADQQCIVDWLNSQLP
ncbi:MAG TPA: hypothetical protein VGP07_11335 [Polyangia bacterium]|jgi:hypothetical protein